MALIKSIYTLSELCKLINLVIMGESWRKACVWSMELALEAEKSTESKRFGSDY